MLNKSLTITVLDSQIQVEKEQRETGIPKQMLKDKDLIKVKSGQLRLLFITYSSNYQW